MRIFASILCGFLVFKFSQAYSRVTTHRNFSVYADHAPSPIGYPDIVDAALVRPLEIVF